MAWTLVTGGAKGLGAEICRALSENGRDVLIHYRKSEREAQKLAEECRKNGVSAEVVSGDFISLEGVKALLSYINERALDIDILINNVGNFSQGSPLELPWEDWLEIFNTNVHAPLLLTRGLIASIRSHEGAVINIGMAGAQKNRADAQFTAYSITKNALYVLTKDLAKELIKDQVRVNMVSPGVLENSVLIPKSKESMLMGRTGSLREVADVVLFLLKPENRYITGQNIEVAGGFSL